MGPGKVVTRELVTSLLFLVFLHQSAGQSGEESTTCRVAAYYPGSGFFRQVTNITIIPPDREARIYPVCCPGYVFNTTEVPDCDRECPSGSCIYGYCPPDDEKVNCKCYDDNFYPRDDNVDCIPVCSPSQDGECTCHAGYTKDEKSNLCVPTECLDRCANGRCDQMGTCTCDEGFVKHTNKTGLCVPVHCFENCRRGGCSADGTCICDEGYKRLDEFTCDRIVCPTFDEEDALFCTSQCASKCKNGNCTEGGHCDCHTGFKSDPNDIYTCNAINCPSSELEEVAFCKSECDTKCTNGTCTDDGTCVCVTAYNTTPEDRYTCTEIICPTNISENLPYCKTMCDSWCNNGVCTDEGFCNCESGFKNNPDDRLTCDQIKCPSNETEDANFCKSDCESKCITGKCSDDGSCNCFAGYKKSELNRFTCLEISCPSFDDAGSEYCKAQCDAVCVGGVCNDGGLCNCVANYLGMFPGYGLESLG